MELAGGIPRDGLALDPSLCDGPDSERDGCWDGLIVVVIEIEREYATQWIRCDASGDIL